jgi:hypothetical protein
LLKLSRDEENHFFFINLVFIIGYLVDTGFPFGSFVCCWYRPVRSVSLSKGLEYSSIFIACCLVKQPEFVRWSLEFLLLFHLGYGRIREGWGGHSLFMKTIYLPANKIDDVT